MRVKVGTAAFRQSTWHHFRSDYRPSRPRGPFRPNKLANPARTLNASTLATVATSHIRDVVDLRSDTVTAPTRSMLECALRAPTGDDVYGEDPTVLDLESYTADLFGKEAALYVPTCSMANLLAILSHCHGRASEMIVGSNSHVSLYEGGSSANLGGVSSRQVSEDENDATLPLQEILAAYRGDDDVHYAKTSLVCIENTHNVMGGVSLSKQYIDALGNLVRNDLDIPLHVDGARIFNASIAQGVAVSELCARVDSVSVCMSKGLGAPLGSILVGGRDFIRLAKRARKRCGGGMRQAGVVASMAMYALTNNVDRLAEDHALAKTLATELKNHGFVLPRNGEIDTNIVYFGMPLHSLIDAETLEKRLFQEYGVKIAGGYTRKGFEGIELFRAVTHMDVTREGIDRASEAIVKLCLQR